MAERIIRSMIAVDGGFINKNAVPQKSNQKVDYTYILYIVYIYQYT